MTIKLANNAVSRLAAALGASDTSLSVQPGDGAKFPALSSGDTFPLTLVKADGSLEIVTCTDVTTDVFTITRGQEGTTPIAFSSGDRVELRLTAGTMDAKFTDPIADAATAAGTAVTTAINLTETNAQEALARLALHSRYDQGDEPTTDQGDIWINGIGACRWDSDDSRYYRIPFTQKITFTSSDSLTLDAWTKYLRVSGCGAGGGGGGGAGYLSGGGFLPGGGGGAGKFTLNQILDVTPGDTLSINIGAGGPGGPGGSVGYSGSVGTDGGTTSITGLLTLAGGGAGRGGSFAGIALGGSGYPGGGQGGYQTTSPTGVYSMSGTGASSVFGGGGMPVTCSPNKADGGDARGYGGGGGGGNTPGDSGQTGGNGGNGSNGILIVEY